MRGKRARRKKKDEEEEDVVVEELEQNQQRNGTNSDENSAWLQPANDKTVDQAGGARGRGVTGGGDVVEGFELMEGWSVNQLELFHALVRVVSKVGDEGAADIQRPLRHLDGVAFGEEMAALSAKARRADDHEIETTAKEGKTQGVTELAMAENDPPERGEKLLTRDTFDKLLEEHSEEKKAKLSSSGVQTDPMANEDGDGFGDESYTALTNKYNVLKQNNRELSFARQALENKLREKTSSQKGWVEYARALEKQKADLVVLLNSHDISTEGLFNSPDPPKVPSTVASNSFRTSPSNSTGVEREPMKDNQSRLSAGLLGTPGGDDSVHTPRINSSRESYQNRRVLRSEQRSEAPCQDNNCTPVLYKLRDHSDTGVSKADTATHITSRDIHKTRVLKIERGDLQASPLHLLSSTHANLEENSVIDEVEQEPEAPVLVKLESPSDTPVVISSRSIRKRKRQSKMEHDDTVKIKVEVISSSPIGLAGFQQLFPQENMDLDDIGEKVDTPKKKRQLARVPSPYIGRYTAHFNGTPTGIASVLQSVSPNKQILPPISGNKQQRKQQQLGRGILGTEIFAEDTDNGTASWNSNSTKSPEEKYRVRAVAGMSSPAQRLMDLPEKPSPPKPFPTPKIAPDVFVARDHPAAGYTSWQQPLPETERRTISVLRQPGVPATPHQQYLSRDSSSDNSKALSRRRPVFRTPRDTTLSDLSSPARIPLRKRKLCDLGLSHFKVNPDFNQGYNYAFADVVRGREQRKCLPGCTKPECCGEKFRKFVEMISKPDEQQTESQEQEDEKLLGEFLGDNRYRLRTMSKAERSELLIQAKTRDLARKAGKHRHAYERRRSPPGFWRTDFPSTQELETDRNEAAMVEKELIQQRYDEAMRPGGKWVFRDE